MAAIPVGPLLTEDEAATYLATSVRHLRGLRLDGRLGYVLVGRKIRYNRPDLDAWLRARRVRPSRA